MQQRDMSITIYTLKIKELCDALISTNVIIDDDEMVQICLNGLAPQFGTMRSTIFTRENPVSFFDLQSILLVEENHARKRSNTPDDEMLYSQSDDRRGLRRGNRGRFGQGQQGQPTRECISHQWQDDRNNSREFGRRRRHPARPSQRNNSIECEYCGKLGHHKEECRKKQRESVLTSRQLTNYATNF